MKVRAVATALAPSGNHGVAAIECDLPRAGLGIRTALREDSLAA